MKLKAIVCSTLLSILAFHGYAQKAKVAAADNKYDRFAYVDAIAVYEQLAAKGYKDEKIFQKLGNAYYFNADFLKALKWYTELFTLNQDQETEYYYRYSQTLKSAGDYTKSDKMLEQFNKKSSNDLRAKLFMSHKNYLEEIKANSGRYTINDAGINSEFSDYGSSFLNKKLIFTSARDTGGVSKRVFKWNNQSFTDLYSSEEKPEGSLADPKRFSKDVNSKFHESTPAFTKDGKTMYFTGNNYLAGKKGKSSENSTLLKLYKATFEGGKWNNVMELPFNSNQYSLAHPALSPDDRTLYFASDMPGTHGQSDLYRVNISGDGSYSVPENLGTTINTEGRETFPYISTDNELYFASDGHPGLGGLDIFVAKIEKNNSFNYIQNIGEPVNGRQDDFALIIDGKTRKGFFTSNREGGMGSDDIYKFNEIRKRSCDQVLIGVITDKDTGLGLSESKLTLFDDNFQIIKEVMTNEKGECRFEVDCGKTYHIRAEKETFQTDETMIAIGKTTGETRVSMSLIQSIKPIVPGTDLAITLNISTILFDLDQSYIRGDAIFELEKIVIVMRQYPEMKIDIRSHTDSRETAKYNLRLSDRRAKSTVEWLVKNGIEKSRLTSKGYGESRLLNYCSDNVECTEEEHQVNRRSEFRVISM